MLNQTSNSFRKLFLLQFTKELIRSTGAGEIFKLEQILKDKKEQQKKSVREKQAREKINEIIKEKEIELDFIKKESEESEKKIPIAWRIAEERRNLPPPKKPVLRIPEPRLPETFSYLKPSPTKTEIDLGKLNPLIKDPLIKVIECNGPDEHVMVTGSMGTKPTGIILNKEEIDDIIIIFSDASKIPVHEGVFKVAIGRLILSAIVSEIVGSKFIIRKMMYYPGFEPV